MEKDAPDYRPGHIISISFMCLAAAGCIVYAVALWFENRKRDRLAAVFSTTNEEIREEDEEVLGDLAPSYRYQY